MQTIFAIFIKKMLNSGNCSVPSAAMAGSEAPTVFFPEAKMRLFYLIRHTIYRRKKIRRQASLRRGTKCGGYYVQTKIYLCYSDPDTACGGRAFRPFKQERHGGVSDVGKTAAVAPGVVFPIVWSILYILMGISSA